MQQKQNIEVEKICTNCKFFGLGDQKCFHKNNITKEDNVNGRHVYSSRSNNVVRNSYCKGDWWELADYQKKFLLERGYNEDGTVKVKIKKDSILRKIMKRIEVWKSGVTLKS